MEPQSSASVSFRRFASSAHLFTGSNAEIVKSVTSRPLVVSLRQSAQDCLVATVIVITLE